MLCEVRLNKRMSLLRRSFHSSCPATVRLISKQNFQFEPREQRPCDRLKFCLPCGR